MSYGIEVVTAGLTVVCVAIEIPSVCPSGAAFATISVPSVPLAPGLFSMMIGWPSAFSSGACNRRATMSAAPPAASGTISRIGLLA